jgi:hypothetical protein
MCDDPLTRGDMPLQTPTNALPACTIAPASTPPASPTAEATNNVARSSAPFVDMASSLPRGKRIRRRTEKVANEELVQPREPKRPGGRPKRTNGGPRLPAKPRQKYFVLNGEVVMAEPESPLSASRPQPSSQTREAGQGSNTTRKRARKDPANHAMKTPPSSPANPVGTRTTAGSTTMASPEMQGMRRTPSLGEGEWPALNRAFDKWEKQVCL